jgi:creatinine amidohydrolase/Fe(II)-dependent formamide hydrolase-like protein
MINSPQFSYFQTIKEVSANGVVGNPSLASKENGEKISQIITSKLVDIIKSQLI